MSMLTALGALALPALLGATDAGSQTGGEPGKSADDQGAGGDTGTQKPGEEKAGAGAGQQTGGDEKPTVDDKKFSQADLDRVVRDRLAEEQKRAQRKADDEKAKAAGEYQKLYEQEKAAREKAEAKAREAELSAVRTAMGSKYGLTERQAGRLQGTTAEEIEADAKAEAEDAKEREKARRPRTGGADGGAGNNAAAGPSMNDAIRRAAGRR